jgi:hypothetical protein
MLLDLDLELSLTSLSNCFAVDRDLDRDRDRDIDLLSFIGDFLFSSDFLVLSESCRLLLRFGDFDLDLVLILFGDLDL